MDASGSLFVIARNEAISAFYIVGYVMRKDCFVIRCPNLLIRTIMVSAIISLQHT